MLQAKRSIPVIDRNEQPKSSIDAFQSDSKTLRDAEIEWIAKTLVEVLRIRKSSAESRATQLLVVADTHNVPTEELWVWCRHVCPGKAWSLAEWRRYCQLPHRPLAA
jgi:hypothetical protein